MSGREDFSAEDPLPALQAEVDQAIALIPMTAPLASAWFAAFQREGFTATQSLYLTAVQLKDNPGRAP